MQLSSYRASIPGSAIADLNDRLARTRWPDQVDNETWETGTELRYLKRLVEYWRDGFDWREQEAHINRFAQFTADLQGHRIHFIHERASNGLGIPLILTHGWPGSFVEMLKIIPLLTDPAAHGAPASPSFDVIVPSLPGYGFSGRPKHSGVSCPVIADLWAQLMSGLGYQRFAAQGGDWGAGITFRLGQRHPERLLGMHFNTQPAWVRGAGIELTKDEEAALAQEAKWNEEENAYGHMHRTKPQTVAYGLTDSPVGLAAWIVEKFRSWSDCDGDVERAFTRDELLTNIALYWFTATIGSSIRIYREELFSPNQLGPGETVDVPAAVACFPKEPYPPRSYFERMFSDLRRWTQMPRGGHFAAMEQPELLAADLRAFFGQLARR